MSTTTAPEPTTFAELQAKGWVPNNRVGAAWFDVEVGCYEVTVFRAGSVMVSTEGVTRLSEADACRLAHRLAAVLCDFVPTT